MRRPPRSSGDSPTRRQYLRRIGGASGAAALAATAGCLGLRDDISPPPTAIGGTGTGAANNLSKDAFTDVVERQREQYGDHGVWGTAGAEPDHDAVFAGAWTRTVGLNTNGNPEPQPESPDGLRAIADAAVIAYEIPERGDSETQYYQLWLWAAARLPGDTDGGVLAATPALRRVEIGVGLDGTGAELGPYTPGSDRTEGPVVISASSPGVDGPTASFPLESGRIRVVPSRTGFDDTAYAVEWRGDTGDPRSVAGTCEVSWSTDQEPSFDLTVRLAADRRRF